MKASRLRSILFIDCCSIVCLLIIYTRICRATSNVHSVWLDASSSLPRPDPTGNSQRVFSPRTGLWLMASQDNLINSASSLQPRIATLDQESSNSGGGSGYTRLDSEPKVSFVNDSITLGGLDLVTTSDWHQSRETNNETNNGQVQFDEDTGQQRLSPARSTSSPLTQNYATNNNTTIIHEDELIPTEVYNNNNNNNTNSPTSQSNAVGFEDFERVSPNANSSPNVANNSSSGSFNNEPANQTANLDAPASFIYYLTDGDQWSQPQRKNRHNQLINQLKDSAQPINQLGSHILMPSNQLNTIPFSPTTNQPVGHYVDKRWRPQQTAAPTTMGLTSRRKLHNSGTQYDLRESHQLQSNLPSSNRFWPNQRRQLDGSDTHDQQPERNLIQFVDQLAYNTDSRRPFASESFGPATHTTTAYPIITQINRQNHQPFVAHAPNSYPFQPQSPLDGPLLVQHPQHHHYYLQSPHQIAAKVASSNRAPQQNRLRRQKVSPSSIRNTWLDPQVNQRSFLQNYVPSLSGYRPKLLRPPSLLANWMSSSSGGSGGSQHLENTFYSTSDAPHNRHPPNRPWSSANNYYTNYEQHSSSGASGTMPQGSRHLYSLLQPNGDENAHAHYSKPTLAPALSHFMQRPHRDLVQTSQAGPQQQSAAGFIPVVAVSVTKTSPLPMPAANSNQMTEVSADQPNGEMDTAVDYQPPPSLATTKRRNQQQQQQAKVHFDDYGNYASGSSGNPATFVANHQRIAYQSAPVETTTVKSALFGYLPHEAERPLLGAMNLFSPLQQQLAADSNRATSLYHHHQQQQQQQLAESQQQHLSEFAKMHNLEEPPTPLGLQLQANSFVQNDIAHPFGVSSIVDPRTPLFYQLDGGATAAANNHYMKHEAPIVQSHQRLMNALLADGSLKNPHLLAAASELNPLMPLVFASPQQSDATTSSQEETTGDQPNRHHQQHQQQQQIEPSRGSSALNNKGNKKRSSDFFASAGQLLLSALPLLLAPTLGLMFASSPGAVARYQGQPSSFNDPNGLHSSAIPSSYMSGLNQGVVSNASPAPHLFTPSPPLLNRYNNSDQLQAKAGQATSSSSPASTTTTLPPTTATRTTTTTNRPQHQGPTLAPIQRLASWTGSTFAPPSKHSLNNYSMIVTTIGPKRSSGGHPSSQNSTDVGTFDHEATHTIVLIQAEDEQPSASVSSRGGPAGNATSEKAKTHYDIGGYEGVDFDAQFPSLRKTMTPQATASQKKQNTIVGHDESNDEEKPLKNRYHYSQVLTDDSLSLNKQEHRHHYKPQSNNNRTVTKSNNYDQTQDDDNDDDNVKLFPVSTWPAMRMRTVSLVTSNGSKTMPDSSEKYNLNPIGANRIRGQQEEEKNGALHSNPAQQVHGSRMKRDLSSSMIESNEIISHANLTLKDGKKRLVKVVKRLRKPTLAANLVKTAVSSSSNSTALIDDPLMSDSSSGKARYFEQADQAKRGDSKSEQSAHIIATMVAQMSDSDQDADTDQDSGSHGQGLRDERDLREHLLRKKMILDRLATSSNRYQSPLESERLRHLNDSGRRPSVELEEEDDSVVEKNLSLGGRGRLPEVISTKVKHLKEVKSRKRNQEDERGANNNLVLADDTRKALTEFGNLLIKDTLQIPYSGKDDLLSRNAKYMKRRKSSEHPRIETTDEVEDNNESSATERSFSRTTPYPPMVTQEHFGRLQQYRQLDSNATNQNYYNDPYSADYNKSLNYSSGGNYQHRHYPYQPIQDQVNLIPPTDQDHIGAGYGPPPPPPGDVGRYGQRDDRQQNDYNTRMNLVASSSRELSPNQSYGSYYSRPPGREQPSPLVPPPPPPPPQQGPPGSRSHYDTRGHHYSYPPVPVNSNYSPPPSPEQNATNYPPPNHRPSDDYYDTRRDNPPFSSPYPEDNHYHHYNKYPNDSRYPAASQEHESWPPRQHDGLRGGDYQSSRDNYNRFAPAAYSPPPLPSIDRDREPSSYATSSPPQQQIGPPMSRSIAGDSSAVNEYLKRVQFSDSDRDKLMASYLTCDGLLNDNDHCLERLSCEFSDPQNIERANKLDRAVSSILLGHILINTYIPNQFKLRLKSASLFGYTHSGNCSKYLCNKLTKSSSASSSSGAGGAL